MEKVYANPGISEGGGRSKVENGKYRCKAFTFRSPRGRGGRGVWASLGYWDSGPAVTIGSALAGRSQSGEGAAWGIGALAFARSQPRGERGDAVLLKGRRGKRAPKTREKGACGAHGSSSIAGQC